MRRAAALALLVLAGCSPMRYRVVAQDTLDNSRRVVSGAVAGGVAGPMGVWTLQRYDEGTTIDPEESVFKFGLSTAVNVGIYAFLAAHCGPCVWWYAGASGALGILEQTALGGTRPEGLPK